jgi:hypothetical protein
VSPDLVSAAPASRRRTAAAKLVVEQQIHRPTIAEASTTTSAMARGGLVQRGVERVDGAVVAAPQALVREGGLN